MPPTYVGRNRNDFEPTEFTNSNQFDSNNQQDQGFPSLLLLGVTTFSRYAPGSELEYPRVEHVCHRHQAGEMSRTY